MQNVRSLQLNTGSAPDDLVFREYFPTLYILPTTERRTNGLNGLDPAGESLQSTRPNNWNVKVDDEGYVHDPGLGWLGATKALTVSYRSLRVERST